MIIGPLKDVRAFAGAVALTIVGAHLSIMMGFYFHPSDSFHVMQARWWWEISLNVQILCLVLMWISQAERMKEAKGWRKVRAILRFFVGMGGCSVPAFVLFLYTTQGWRENSPDGMELAYYAGLVFVCWVSAAYVVPLFVGLFSRQLKFARLSVSVRSKRKFVQVVPFGTLALLALLEYLRGGSLHIVFWPFLTYLHGAVPYYLKAYPKRQENEYLSGI